MEPPTDLLRATLDLLILRSLATEPLHGLGHAAPRQVLPSDAARREAGSAT